MEITITNRVLSNEFAGDYEVYYNLQDESINYDGVRLISLNNADTDLKALNYLNSIESELISLIGDKIAKDENKYILSSSENRYNLKKNVNQAIIDLDYIIDYADLMSIVQLRQSIMKLALYEKKIIKRLVKT